MAKSMILISGATGSVGGATARQLLKEGYGTHAMNIEEFITKHKAAFVESPKRFRLEAIQR